MHDDLVEITNLCFNYANHLVFDEVSINVRRGKIVAIMGPSGSGKTTLLRLIGGLLTPDSGTIRVDGKYMHKLSYKSLCKLRNKMGLLFQSNALFTDLNVFDNVAFPLRQHTQLDAELLRELVLMKLEAVGLRGARGLMPSQLSGGMARRVALARTIVLDPKLLMYDEPFTGQDPISKAILVRLIKRLNELLNITTIIVSHDVMETCSIADYIYLILDGKIVSHGTPDDLLQSNQAAVRQFMHGEIDGAFPFHYSTKKSYQEDLLDASTN